MLIVSVIASLSSIWIIGVPFLLLLGARSKYRYGIIEFVPLAFFTGCGLISLIQIAFFFFHLQLTFSRILLVNFLCFLFIIIILPGYLHKIKPETDVSINQREGWKALEIVLLFCIVAQIIWVILITLPMPVNSFDVVRNYALKAKIFYLNSGMPQDFFVWKEPAVSLPEYPLFLPLLMSWVYYFVGFNDLLITKIMPLIYIMFIALFYSLSRRFLNRVNSLLSVFLLFSLPQVFRYATILYTDLVLTAYVTSAFLFCILYIKEKRNVFLFISSLLFGFSLWVKNEAILFAIGFVAILFLHLFLSHAKNRKTLLKWVFLSLLIMALIYLPWIIIKKSYRLASCTNNFAQLSINKLSQNLKESGAIPYNLQKEFFNPKKWNLFWLILTVVLIWKRKVLLKGLIKYPVIFLIICALGYIFTYLTLTGFGLAFTVSKTMSRFLLHFCGICSFLLVFLFAEKKSE